MVDELKLKNLNELEISIKDISEVNFGSRLQRKRMAQKISVDEIAKLTYISRDFLYALEANEFEKFPAEAYAIGFIRTYCKVLGIPSDEYVKEYEEYLKMEVPKSSQSTITSNMVSIQNQGRKRFYIFVFAMFLMIAGVGATVWFLYYQNILEQQSQTETDTLQGDGTVTRSETTTTPSINSGLLNDNTTTQP